MVSSTQAPVPQKPRKSIYKGDPGMWSWVAHRITGVCIFFFLFVHVLDTALVRVSQSAYNHVIETYQSPIIGLMEIGLVALLVFHAFNGIRIVLVDFWSKGPKYQRQMLWIVLGLFALVFAASTWRLLSIMFTHIDLF